MIFFFFGVVYTTAYYAVFDTFGVWLDSGCNSLSGCNIVGSLNVWERKHIVARNSTRVTCMLENFTSHLGVSDACAILFSLSQNTQISTQSCNHDTIKIVCINFDCLIVVKMGRFLAETRRCQWQCRRVLYHFAGCSQVSSRNSID